MGFGKEANLLSTSSSILHWLMDILAVEPTALALDALPARQLPFRSRSLRETLCSLMGARVHPVHRSCQRR